MDFFIAIGYNIITVKVKKPKLNFNVKVVSL